MQEKVDADGRWAYYQDDNRRVREDVVGIVVAIVVSAVCVVYLDKASIKRVIGVWIEQIVGINLPNGTNTTNTTNTTTNTTTIIITNTTTTIDTNTILTVIGIGTLLYSLAVVFRTVARVGGGDGVLVVRGVGVSLMTSRRHPNGGVKFVPWGVILRAVKVEIFQGCRVCEQVYLVCLEDNNNVKFLLSNPCNAAAVAAQQNACCGGATLIPIVGGEELQERVHNFVNTCL